MNLPAEIMDKICNDLKTPDLLRLNQTSREIYNMCLREVQKRKEEKYQKVGNLINRSNFLHFYKEKRLVHISRIDRVIFIHQFGHDMSPILEQMESVDVGYFKQTLNIKQLAKNLVNQGWSLFQL